MVTNLLFTRIFILIYGCFIRIYVTIFQNLIYLFEELKRKKVLHVRNMTIEKKDLFL